MVVPVQQRLSIIFIKSMKVGVARATLSHTLAMPLHVMHIIVFIVVMLSELGMGTL